MCASREALIPLYAKVAPIRKQRLPPDRIKDIESLGVDSLSLQVPLIQTLSFEDVERGAPTLWIFEYRCLCLSNPVAVECFPDPSFIHCFEICR